MADQITKKIILIEDEDFIRFLYKRQLDLAGFSTEGYADGKEGLKAIQERKPDLALIDIMLPGTNGMEIVKTLKQDDSTKDIPLVIFSNLGQEEVVKEAFRLGVKDYFIKSNFSPYDVVEKVRSILIPQTSNIV